jgi:L,D-transpeptidase YcbB
LAAAAACGAAALAPGCARGKSSATAEAGLELGIRSRLESPPPPDYLEKDEAGRRLWSDVRRFYTARREAPAWFRGRRASGEAAEMVRLVAEAPGEGLETADYDLGPVPDVVARYASSRASLTSAEVAEAELRLSTVFLKYARDVATGRVPPRELDRGWVGETTALDLPAILDSATSGAGVRAALESQRPRHEQYARLERALGRYREIAARGGWPTSLRPDASLRPGSRSPQVQVLRARLRASGDLEDGALLARLARPFRPADRFDDALAAAVSAFARREGLEPGGALDPKAVAALNVPVEQRIRQIELNLERWRWLPRDLGPRYVLVNTPTFELDAIEGGKAALHMRVAVGARDHPTPIFSAPLTEVVFSPYWNIPPRIARQEWIPEVVRDPGYLRDNGLEIVKGDRVLDLSEVNWSDDDLRLRQRPGAANLLGLVTFKFPNPFDVYIHDTPFDSAFHRAARAVSHGCVRVEEPEALAEWVLRDDGGWTRTRIEEAMHGGVERAVRLEHPIPVHIVYQTVWVADDGSVRFAEDLYGHDARQLAILARKEGSPRTPEARASTPPRAR